MNIGILTGCHSDVVLTDKITEELVDYTFIRLTQNNIIDSYHNANYLFKKFKLDFVLAVGDRPEQIGGVLAAFQNKILIGHLYAGDHNTVSTFDDIHRHSITLYSSIQFCSCKESVDNTIRLMRGAGLVPNANLVGATHFDNREYKDFPGLSRIKPYVLILINSETLGDDEKISQEAVEAYNNIVREHWKKCLPSPKLIIAKGNNDNENIETKIFCRAGQEININCGVTIVRENRTDHNFFLSLISNCMYFISNSSSVIYEAPFLIKPDQIIHIGNRNKGRTKIPKESHDGHASERVAKLIKTFLEERNVI